MKAHIGITIAMMLCTVAMFGQDSPPSETPGWEFNAELNFYFFKDDFFALPVFQADKNKLHLEARYNYEDMQTFSGWVGWNFKGGNKLEYAITPMIGGVVGLTNGIAPGLEMTYALGKFELYSESELVLDPKIAENHFFYNWTDLTYSPKDWLWVGISGQRTRLYKTALDLQRGVLIGGALKNWELTAYVYNVGFDDPFVLLSVSTKF
ncbi:MAG TPA: hypothetical protein VG737_15645 [Cyclobacteriaceae bacterium]|nr:hypothetical protein [Cyclobacteriaceae bacterium]